MLLCCTERPAVSKKLRRKNSAESAVTNLGEIGPWKHAECIVECTISICKGLFTWTFSMYVSASVSVKVYHCANGNGPFDGQNGFRIHSDCQTNRHYIHNVNLTEMVMDTETETVCVNRLLGSIHIELLAIALSMPKKMETEYYQWWHSHCKMISDSYACRKRQIFSKEWVGYGISLVSIAIAKELLFSIAIAKLSVNRR